MKSVLIQISLLLILSTLFFSCQKAFDFSKMTEEEQIEFYQITADAVFEKGDVLFKSCKNAEEFGENLDQIRSISGVTDAYICNNAVFIQLVGGGTLSYLYTVSPSFESVNSHTGETKDLFDMTRSESYRSSFISKGLEGKTACIANQMHEDERFSYIPVSIVPYTKNFFDKSGIQVNAATLPSRDFFSSEIFDYDFIFLITHGEYDDRTDTHWLLTSDRLNSAQRLWDSVWGYGNVSVVNEVHDRDTVEVKYFMISDRDIASSENSFKDGPTVFFNTACQSLMGSENLYNTLKEKGVDAYLGYDESNAVGAEAGMYFIGRIMSGMSIADAYLDLPYYCLKDSREETNQNRIVIRRWVAYLHCLYEEKSIVQDLYFVSPINKEISNQITDGRVNIKLTASAPLYAPQSIAYQDKEWQWKRADYNFDYSSFRYGFVLSETTNRDDGIICCEMAATDDNCSYEPYQVSFSYINDGFDLEPDKQYYYWSYIYDGHKYDFSERSSFETKRINRVIPEEIIDQMDDYIPIYEGKNPPNVEGQYLLSPSELVYDSTHGFSIGHIFDDLYFQFLNQDMENNTLDYVEEQGNSSQVGTGAFISGEGDRFSVFFNTDGNAVYDDYSFWYKTALVISGIKTADGIKDLDYAFVLVDKGDDPKPYYIPSGSFRVFKDGDGLSTNTNYFSRRTSAPLKPMSYNPKPLPSMFEVEPN